jgi:CheY-like chemotaxis protein
MLETKTSQISLRVLVVDDELGSATAEGRAIRSLIQDLQKRAIEVVEATSAEDGKSVIASDSAIHAVLVDWNLGDDDKEHERASSLIRFLRSRNDKIPIFLMAERKEGSAITVETLEQVDEFIWTLEDTAAFVSGRVLAAIRRYGAAILPPMPRQWRRSARTSRK